MNKEKLEKEARKIEGKLKIKETKIKDSPEYKLLATTSKDLWKKRLELERELKDLRKPIYLKYANRVLNGWTGIFFKQDSIKSSVKQGIKTGLGLTNVSFIDKSDLKKIVTQLIERDLEKIEAQTDNLKSKIKERNIQIKKYDDKENKLMRGLDALKKQREMINKKLNEKEYLKDKRIRDKRKEVKIKINKNLPDFMDKIVKEVNKQLILDGLE